MRIYQNWETRWQLVTLLSNYNRLGFTYMTSNVFFPSRPRLTGPVDAPGAMLGLPWERRVGVFLGRHAPWANRWLMATLRNPGRDTEAFARRYSAHSCAEDLALLADPDFGGMMRASYAASCRYGVAGFAQDVNLLVRPWGFPLAGIRAPVHIWHAREDHGTPLPMAEAMARAVPGSRLRVFEGGSHFLLFTYWGELLDKLLD